MPLGHGVADPHTHTTASDGMVSPRQLVAAAAGTGLSVVAITDHDTFSGCAEALGAAQEYGIEVVAGEEVTTS
ncbi:MAG: PHP domain-containing protein, partial [Candidatus Dormiibacterota bacterium]